MSCEALQWLDFVVLNRSVQGSIVENEREIFVRKKTFCIKCLHEMTASPIINKQKTTFMNFAMIDGRLRFPTRFENNFFRFKVYEGRELYDFSILNLLYLLTSNLSLHLRYRGNFCLRTCFFFNFFCKHCLQRNPGYEDAKSSSNRM